MQIEELRRRIDEIDKKIAELIAERASIVQQIGEKKQGEGRPALDTSREAEILRFLGQADLGPLQPEAMKAIFAEIISACRALEEPTSVAYLGPPYTFTHLAALRRFGKQSRYVDCASVHRVFEVVETGQATVGVVPVENSLAGAVPETLDCFLQTELQIIDELYQPIVHCLLANCSMKEIRRLHTHPQAFVQCQRWVREHLPAVDVIHQSSTAAAAKAAAAEEKSAAIAPCEAAEAYGLQVLQRGIQDAANNRTRFFVIGRGQARPTGKDKTSLLFTTRHEAGALHQALTPLRVYGINMTMIQSRPVPGRLWEYVFFVDIEGHAEEERVRRAIEDMGALTPRIVVLGSYPAAGI